MRTALIDSNYICYRAMFSTNNLRYHGIRTGIIYGFFNQLITLAEAIKPDNIYFFWDSKSSERKKLLPVYKENRKVPLTEVEKKEREAAFAQFTQLRRTILPEIGFNNNIIQKGYESDDCIARYVLDNHTREDIIIATADDDMLQLLQTCKIYNIHRNKYYTADQFRTDYGIEPETWIEVKKIAGCNSDNIPGVPGVGIKTAIKYLTGGLKESSKAYKNIKSSPEVMEFNHKLVALPFPGTKHIEVVDNDFSTIAFLRICRRFGMHSFRKPDKWVQIKQLFTGGTDKWQKQKKRKQNEQRKKSRKRMKTRPPRRVRKEKR